VPLPPRWQWKLDRWRESLRAAFRGDPAERRPRLCPACGTLVGTTATNCHECGASLTFSIAAASRSLSNLLPASSPATYIILGINCFLFGVTLMASASAGGGGAQNFGRVDPEVLLRLGARQSLYILYLNEMWRLVMPIFLHGGFMHFLFNSWVLMDIGPQVEEIYGSPRYLFLYVFTGIASFVVSMGWNLYTVAGYGLSIGASGSLMGLVGLMLAITTRRGGAYMQMIRSSLIRWVVLIFVLGFFFNADHAAHAGGLAAGFLLGRMMEDREPLNANERNRAYALGWVAALVVAASFGVMLIHYFRGAQS
jgi:rhomboid protease GluP